MVYAQVIEAGAIPLNLGKISDDFDDSYMKKLGSRCDNADNRLSDHGNGSIAEGC
jgi:hypothetical protein